MKRILLVLMAAWALSAAQAAQETAPTSVAAAGMRKIRTVDPRFVSYNIEMVEVTGGRFWKPYSAVSELRTDANAAASPPSSPFTDPNRFQYRPPIDLTSARLRNLAKAVGPAYIRVSGSWANTTYFQDDDKPALKEAPAGFNGVLTRAEWKGVVDFAQTVGAQIVTSFAVSPGTRDANGVWLPRQAKALLDYTAALHVHVPAVEFMNEPTIGAQTAAPPGYDTSAFVRDLRVFREFLRKELPDALLLGPASTGDYTPAGRSPLRLLKTEDVLRMTGHAFDVFSYHFYGALSARCSTSSSTGGGRGVTIDHVLSPDWLDRTDAAEEFYADWRDRYDPGKPMWLTETAEAACGGDPFAGQFADTFRFLNQLGTLARRGVKVVMHNTLPASDYGLLDENTLEPRPDYWAAVLWNRTMGVTVLDPGSSGGSALRVYAQCMKNAPGGVTILALNTDATAHELSVPMEGQRFALTAPDLTSFHSLLNGRELKANSDGTVGAMPGESFKAGLVRLPPQSSTFLTLPSAHNSSCRAGS
jgi:heparanase 1